MPATKKTEQKANQIKAKSGIKSGVIWLSSEGNYFEEPEIDAELIRDLELNIYLAGIIRKEVLLVFSDKYSITVKDKADEVDEGLGKEITKMFDAPNVKLWPAIRTAYSDIFPYGAAFFNPVWGYAEGSSREFILKELRYLPAYSFKDAPYDTVKTQGEILQGVVLSDENKIEYHQIDLDGTVQELENVLMVKDPTAPEIAGKSVILPMIPMISMVKFVWRTQMKQANRVGAKVIFLKITEPQGASELNGNVSDEAYGRELLQKWGNDLPYILRGNMDIVDPHLKDDSNNLEIINALHGALIDYVSPSSLISGEGGIIGSSDKAREQLRAKYIEGIHMWLEAAFGPLAQQYLDYNGFEGYTAEINIPSPGIDRSELKAKQAELLSKTRSGHINEIRTLLGQTELDEEGLEKLKDELDLFSPPAGGGGMFEDSAQFATATPETVEQVEKTLEEKLEDIADELSKDVIKALHNE